MKENTVSTCSECRSKEGSYHKYGCNQEICPFCSGSLKRCNCHYVKMSGKKPDYSKLVFDFEARIEAGLTENQAMLEYNNAMKKIREAQDIREPDDKYWVEWEAYLNSRGRIPYTAMSRVRDGSRET